MNTTTTVELQLVCSFLHILLSLFWKLGGYFHSAISLLYLPRIDKLRLVVEIMPKQNRCHKFDSDHIFGPE